MAQASCPDCKLEKTINLGGAILTPDVCDVPAGCPTCRRVVVVDQARPTPHRCPTRRCKGSPSVIGDLTDRNPREDPDVIFYWPLKGEDEVVEGALHYQLGRGPYTCPACGGQRLTFEHVGWAC